MSDRIFKKNPISRAAAYLLVIPFIPALRPVLSEHSTGELIIYITGLILTLTLIIISNLSPYIKLSDEHLFIYLLYKYKPEIHKLSSIEEIRVLTKRKVEIKSPGFEKLEIRLPGKEMISLISLLEEKNLEVNKVYRNL